MSTPCWSGAWRGGEDTPTHSPISPSPLTPPHRLPIFPSRSAVNLPTHAPLLAATLALLHRGAAGYSSSSSSVSGLPAAVLATLPVHLRAALADGDGLRVRLLLRLLAAFGGAGVVSPAEVLGQLNLLVRRAAHPPPPSHHATQTSSSASASADDFHREAEFLVYASLAALPWLANTAPGPAGAFGLADTSASAAAADFFAGVRGLVEGPQAQAQAQAHAHAHSPVAHAHALGPALEARALIAARQRAGAASSWIDAPADAAARLGVDLASLSAHPVRRLWSLVSGAVADAEARAGGAAGAVDEDEDVEDVEEGKGHASPYASLAVPSIARPLDDAEVVAALALGAPSSSSSSSSAASSPDADGDASISGAGAAAAGSAPAPAPAAPEPAAEAPPSSSSSSSIMHIPKKKKVDEVDEAARRREAWRAAPASAARPSAIAYRAVHFDAGWRVAGDGEADGHAPLPPAPPAAPLSPAARFHVRPAVQLFGAGGLSSTQAALTHLGLNTPRATPLALWAAREVAHDSIPLFWPLHGECAKRLLFPPMGRGRGAPTPFPSLPIAIEAVLTQSLWLPAPPSPLSSAYFTVLLLDLFREDAAEAASRSSSSSSSASRGPPPATAAAVLGLASRVLFKYAPVLDDTLVDRLATWMAQHISNTSFAWLWKEWEGAAAPAVPLHDPQRRFVSALLSRTFALVGPYHHDAVVASLPPAFVEAGLVPSRVTEAAASRYLEVQPAPQAAAAAAAAAIAAPAPAAATATSSSSSATAAAAADDEALDYGDDSACQGAPSSTAGGAADVTAEEADILRSTAPGAAISHHSLSSGTPTPGMAGAAEEIGPRSGLPSALTAAVASIPAEELDDLAGSSASALRAFAQEALVKLRAKTEDAAMTVWYRGHVEAASTGAGGGREAGISRESFLRAFCHALLVYGRANIRNAFTLFERYHLLLTVGCGVSPPAVRAHTLLGAITSVWSRAPHAVPAIVAAAVDAKVVAPAHVVTFALDPADAKILTDAEGHASSAAAASSLSPAALREHLIPRLSQPATWALFHGALARAEAASHAAGVEVALFRGARVFDAKEEEVAEAVAAERETALVAAGQGAAAAFREAVLAAVAKLARVGRALEAYLSESEATGDAGATAASAEVLRVVLAHGRDVGRRYAAVLATPAGSAAITAALEGTTHLLAAAPHAAHPAHGGAPHVARDGDLTGALLHSLRSYAQPRAAHTPALQRDREAPRPVDVSREPVAHVRPAQQHAYGTALAAAAVAAASSSATNSSEGAHAEHHHHHHHHHDHHHAHKEKLDDDENL